MKKVFLKISQNSQENTCARVFFNKVSVLRPATLLKKKHWHRCFPMNFGKFLRTPFFIEYLWWLLLEMYQVYAQDSITSLIVNFNTDFRAHSIVFAVAIEKLNFLFTIFFTAPNTIINE